MITDIQGLIKSITKQIKEFTDIAVIGLSGGADSTLVATLCVQALGNNKVFGVHMPADRFDLSTFNSDSTKLAKHLGINSITVPVGGIAEMLQEEIITKIWKNPSSHPTTKLTKGNMKARLRMTILYSIVEELSNSFFDDKVRVMGTDNLSENFIGYFTKYGDGGVDCNPIGELFKSEVYQVLQYFVDTKYLPENLINKIPSAGLWEGQTDEGELGFTYNEIEESIKTYYNSYITSHVNTDSKCFQFVEQMHDKNNHKNKIPESFSLRRFCDWEYDHDYK
jgi:NAD+ synthase